MANPQTQKSAQLSFLLPCPEKENLLGKLVLHNQILSAEPVPLGEAVAPGRYRLNLNIQIPGQWRLAEVERVLELTGNWGWGGVLDLEALAEIEALLDAVAARGGV